MSKYFQVSLGSENCPPFLFHAPRPRLQDPMGQIIGKLKCPLREFIKNWKQLELFGRDVWFYQNEQIWFGSPIVFLWSGTS